MFWRKSLILNVWFFPVKSLHVWWSIYLLSFKWHLQSNSDFLWWSHISYQYIYRIVHMFLFGLAPFNTLRPRQNDHHFSDNIFRCIFLYENVWISIKISLKFVPNGPINDKPALVQIMAWRLLGDKPLSEQMMVSLMPQICVTQPQWVNSSPPSAAYVRQWIRSVLVQILACHLFCAKPSSEQMLECCYLDP